ncbi:hypothetical protein WDU94_011179 [Cyamophila willieti]
MSSSSAGHKSKGFVGIHIGAGKHSKKRYPLYSKILAMACKQAINLIQNGGSALKAAALATALLEDCKLFNAGSGSNLTWEGGVECDAGIMDGKTGLSGAVGAVTRVQNPIHVAYRLCQKQSGLDNGLIRPCMMVGPGAFDYARQTGASHIFETEEEMVSPYARRDYVKTKEKVRILQQQEDENMEEEEVLAKTKVKSVQKESKSSPKKNPVDANSSLSNIVLPVSIASSSCTSNVHVKIEPTRSNSKVRKRKLDTNDEDTKEINDDMGKSAKSNEEVREDINDQMKNSAEERNEEERGEKAGGGEEEEEEEEQRLDTVGVVCVDLEGNVASSCSSGGIILKRSGRIGQACIRGSGWWAQNSTTNSYGVAISTTGPGEYLIRTSLAREVARVFGNKVVSGPEDDDEEESVNDGNSVLLEKCMREEFLGSPFLRDVAFPKQAGLILLLISPHDNSPVEFLWAFSSHSFCVGYMSTQDKQAHTRMSILPESCVPGTAVNVESVYC